MPKFADRVQETTTTTGTGAITLAGAVTQFQDFATAFGSSPVYVNYAIIDQGSADWEVGKGEFNGTTTLTRYLVRASSNAGALVNFAAGTKTVFCTITAEHADNSNKGSVLAQVMGWATP